MAYTHAVSTNQFGVSAFNVDATVSNGTHTTISLALSQSVSGQTIFIKPGTYVENLTLVPGVNLTAFTCDSSMNGTGNVIISGTCTLTAAGSVTISGIQLQTNSAALLAVTGSAASIVNLKDCYLNMTNNTGITFSAANTSAIIDINNCVGNLGTTGIGIFAHSSTGTLVVTGSYFNNSGGSSTASTVSAGTLSISYSALSNPVTSSSTGFVGMTFSSIDSSAQNATSLTAGGSVAHDIEFSRFRAGSASAISISNTTAIRNSEISSTNTNAITGAGTINYTNLFFSNTSRKINTTTQSGGVASGGLTQAPSAGFIGEQISSSVALASAVGITTNTATNITSISLTAGIWDVSALGSLYCSVNVTGTAFTMSISTTSATRGTAGDNECSTNVNVNTNAGIGLPIPSYRITLTATTTVYLVGFGLYTLGTLTGYGRISATRMG